MVDEYRSDLAEALKIIVSYLNGKGQLPPLDKLILINMYSNAFKEVYGIDVIDLEKIIELSINSPSFVRPLWLQALAELAKINSKTEIITQTYKKKPLIGD